MGEDLDRTIVREVAAHAAEHAQPKPVDGRLQFLRRLDRPYANCVLAKVVNLIASAGSVPVPTDVEANQPEPHLRPPLNDLIGELNATAADGVNLARHASTGVE